MLVRDGAGHVLLVEPTYKPIWEIPGGAVDADESPRECVIREVREELNIDAEPGRLLVVDYQHPEPDRTESMMFVFDGGMVGSEWTNRIVLASDELHSWRLVAPADLARLASGRLCRRLANALEAVVAGQTRYLENGRGVM